MNNLNMIHYSGSISAHSHHANDIPSPHDERGSFTVEEGAAGFGF